MKALVTLCGLWAAMIIIMGRFYMLGTNPWPIAALSLGPGLLVLFIFWLRDPN